MDHSIQGYLERRTTEELHYAFRYCLHQDDFLFYEHISVMCLNVLETRLSSTDHIIQEYRLALEERKRAFQKKEDSE